jgi:hypothetical protein
VRVIAQHSVIPATVLAIIIITIMTVVNLAAR